MKWRENTRVGCAMLLLALVSGKGWCAGIPEGCPEEVPAASGDGLLADPGRGRNALFSCETGSGDMLAASGGKSLLRLGEPGKKERPIDIFGMPDEIEEESLVGVYLRSKVPVDGTLSVSGTVGYTYAGLFLDEDENPESKSESESESDVSYGLGAEIRINPTVSLFVDYMRYMDTLEHQLNHLNLRVSGNF